MANTTDTTEGAEPLADPDAASWSLTSASPAGEVLFHSGDASLPPAGEGDSFTESAAQDFPEGADSAHPSAEAEKCVDELIATLPSMVVDSLSAQDIEALASGDPQAVARILQEIPDGKDDDADDAASPLAARAETGPERISLRGLSASDRIALADMVRAVKEGRYASLDEARAALQPETAAPYPAAEEAYPAEMPGSGLSLADALQRMAHLQSLEHEAASTYDSAALQQLHGAMAHAALELQQAEAQEHVHQQQAHTWAHHEAHQIASVHQAVAAELADEAFSRALLDERDLAEMRDDPVMHRPDWPLQLVERTRERLLRSGGGAGARPQARARGMVASPSSRGGVALSLDEAFDQIDGLSESEVDAVLSQMREREKASRFSRAA